MNSRIFHNEVGIILNNQTPNRKNVQETYKIGNRCGKKGLKVEVNPIKNHVFKGSYPQMMKVIHTKTTVIHRK